jgi:hypothetical protein
LLVPVGGASTPAGFKNIVDDVVEDLETTVEGVEDAARLERDGPEVKVVEVVVEVVI